MKKLLRFELCTDGQLRFEPSNEVLEHLARRHARARSVLHTVCSSGVNIDGDLGALTAHPAAHGLVAYQQGYLSAEKAEACIALLTGLDSIRRARVQDGTLAVHQSDALLPTVETRGETISLDSRAPTDAHALDAMLAEVMSVGGAGIREIASIIKTISLVVVKGMPDLPYFSGSATDTWGAMHMSLPANAVILGESLTHEAAHFWLHLVEEISEFAPKAWDENVWVSPWREDPRPIGGIVHGVHVFSSAALLTSQWLNTGVTLPAGVDRGTVEARVACLVAQVEEGIQELSRHHSLSCVSESIAVDSELRLRWPRDRVGSRVMELARSRTAERRSAKIAAWNLGGSRSI